MAYIPLNPDTLPRRPLNPTIVPLRKPQTDELKLRSTETRIRWQIDLPPGHTALLMDSRPK